MPSAENTRVTNLETSITDSTGTNNDGICQIESEIDVQNTLITDMIQQCQKWDKKASDGGLYCTETSWNNYNKENHNQLVLKTSKLGKPMIDVHDCQYAADFSVYLPEPVASQIDTIMLNDCFNSSFVVRHPSPIIEIS